MRSEDRTITKFYCENRMTDQKRQKTDLQSHNRVLFFDEMAVSPEAAERVDDVLDTEALPNVLKTRDLAVLLDMSPDAVNDLARKGILKGYKSGNQWRFRRKDVEKYLGIEMRKLAPPG